MQNLCIDPEFVLDPKYIGKILSLVTVFFLFFNESVFSQAASPKAEAAEIVPKNGKISGKIIDSDTNSPMSYANIAIFSKQGIMNKFWV